MKRVLLIEDDPFIGNVYRDKFGREGFAVDVARDGKSGLDLFYGNDPDVVLLDLMLPEINGVEVLRMIRARSGPHHVPILVFSNAYLGGMVQEAWEAGASQVLTKGNHTPKQVVQAVKDVFDNSPAAFARARLLAAQPATRSEMVIEPGNSQTFSPSRPRKLARLPRSLQRPRDGAKGLFGKHA